MTYSDEVLADSPTLWWRFADAPGTTSIYDSSANHMPPTYTNGAGSTYPTFGQTGLLTSEPATTSALATTSSVLAQNVWAAIKANTAIAFEVVVKNPSASLVSGSNAYGWIVDRGGSANPFHRMAIDGTTVRFWVSVGSTTGIGTTHTLTATVPALNDGNAHHVVCSYGPSGSSAPGMYIYVDGAQVAQNATPTANLSTTGFYNPNFLRDVNNTAHYNGDIQEFAWYLTGLPSSRVAAHYNATGLGSTPATGSLNATLPALTASLSATSTAPTDTATLDATLPTLSGSFAGRGHLSPWREKVLSTNPVMWWDGEATVAADATTGAVWLLDVSGHGLDSDQFSVGNNKIDSLIPGDVGGKGMHSNDSWPTIDHNNDPRIMGTSGATAFTVRWPTQPSNGLSVSQNLVDRNDGEIEVTPGTNTLRLRAHTTQMDTGIALSEMFDAKAHLFVLTWDATDTRLYLDGTLRATAAATPGPAIQNSQWRWKFCQSSGDVADYDDVVFWDRKLTAADVTGLKTAWDLQLNAVLPALTGSFSGTTAKPVITGTADVTLPTLGASFAATASVPTVTVSLDATLPGLAATFAGSSVDPGVVGGTLDVTLPALTGSFSSAVAVVGTFADTLPALVGAFDGTAALPAEVATTDTFNRSNGRRRTGISYATVTYPPATPPTHIVPVPVRIMAQQIGGTP